MSKKKKQPIRNKPRPVYICPRCRMLWVYDTDPYCLICKILGEPQNDGAKKTIKKIEFFSGDEKNFEKG